VLPVAGVHSTARTPSTKSVAEAVKLTTAPAGPVASTTISAGTVRLGAVVSATVTGNVRLVELPCASVAEHVTVVVPMRNVLPEAGPHVVATAPSTMSEAVALYETTAPPELVASVVGTTGTVIVGGVLSVIVTVNDLLAVFPRLSVEAQVTVVTPTGIATGNALPDAGVQVTLVAPSTTSAAEAANVTDAPAAPVASCVMSPGTVTTGGFVSTTVTGNVFELELPRVSVDEQVTLVLPRGKVDPDACEHDTVVAPSTTSEALAANVTAAPFGPVASTPATLSGAVTTGGVVSATVTVKLPLAVLPRASVAEQLTVVVAMPNIPAAGAQLTEMAPSTMSVALAA
jgi:hypothetical protein